MNILIYDNDYESTGPISIRELHNSLLAVVNPRYSIEHVSCDHLNNDHWEASTALLVIPGGRARPHYQNLAAGGNQKIVEYVRSGGKYLGLCAGAYYGAAQTIFERGGDLAINDSGPLNFYPGIAEGPAYGLGKFKYKDESGAQLATICFETVGKISNILKIYFNGGCFFHSHHNKQNIEILARYHDIQDQPAAIVECAVGAGKAILSGVHIEYSHRDIEEDLRLGFFASVLKRLDPASCL